MNKKDVLYFLEKEKVKYEITEHEAVFNMEQLAQVELPYPECDAKNIFVRDDKKLNYYLITVKNNKRVDLKVFKKTYGTRHLSFASEEDLLDILKLKAGSVSPLGLLNDNQLKVKFYLDKDFLVGNQIIGVHPNDNTATVWLNANELVNLIKKHGNEIEIVEIN